MTANGEGLGFTMSTDLVTADWIDPSIESVDYPVLNAVLLSTHKSCHGKATGIIRQEVIDSSFLLALTRKVGKMDFILALKPITLCILCSEPTARKEVCLQKKVS